MEYYKTNELYHHGILGMRWGVRRFQPYPKGFKGGKEIGEAAKKARGGSFRERRAKKRMAEQQSEILQRARAEKDEKAAREARFEEVKKRPTAKGILEFADDLSTKDLEDLNRRMKVIRELEEKSVEDAEKKSGFNKIDKVMKKIDKVQNWGRTSVNTYKTISDLEDILSGVFDKEKEIDRKRSDLQEKNLNEQLEKKKNNDDKK